MARLRSNVTENIVMARKKYHARVGKSKGARFSAAGRVEAEVEWVTSSVEFTRVMSKYTPVNYRRMQLGACSDQGSL
jgi:hypothetical protein